MKKILFALVVLLAAQASHAVLQYRYRHSFGDGSVSGWSIVRGSTCNTLTPFDDPGAFTSCNQPEMSGPRVSTWEWSSSAGQCKRRLTMGACSFIASSGEATEETREAPANEICESGSQSSLNLTRGYSSKDPDGGIGYADYLPNGQRNPDPSGAAPAVPASMCVGGCTVNVGDATDFWSSRQPTATGMYRMSSDHTATKTGAPCTATASDNDLADGTKAAPACAGQFGYINGRPACIPTSAPTGTGTSTQKPFGNGTGVNQGNPTAGSGPPTIPETNGDGGNKGGPADPRDGTRVMPDGTVVTGTSSTPASGTKTRVEGEEQVECGAPGQPRCRIDETGTPSDANSKYSSANAQLDSQKAALEALIEGAASKTAPGWTWSFQLPTSCAPIVTPAFEEFFSTIDICSFQDVIHDLMSLLWLACTIWACVGMVGATLRGS